MEVKNIYEYVCLLKIKHKKTWNILRIIFYIYFLSVFSYIFFAGSILQILNKFPFEPWFLLLFGSLVIIFGWRLISEFILYKILKKDIWEISKKIIKIYTILNFSYFYRKKILKN